MENANQQEILGLVEGSCSSFRPRQVRGLGLASQEVRAGLDNVGQVGQEMLVEVDHAEELPERTDERRLRELNDCLDFVRQRSNA